MSENQNHSKRLSHGAGAGIKRMMSGKGAKGGKGGDPRHDEYASERM
jgi:hypothetical protein